jgi:hypothetical protein
MRRRRRATRARTRWRNAQVGFIDPPRGALQPIFALLMERGTVDTDRGGTLWDPTLEADVPVTDVPDAGERVATGHLPSFNVVINGIEVNGITIRPLGAFVFEDELALDYRMGDEWTPPVLAAFAQLLDTMRALAPGAELQASWRRCRAS